MASSIKRSKSFNKGCMAEIFFMEKIGKIEYVRGNINMEVRTRKGKEYYIIYRYDSESEMYYPELETSDKEVVAEHFYNIDEYECIGWDVEFFTAKKIMNEYKYLNPNKMEVAC